MKNATMIAVLLLAAAPTLGSGVGATELAVWNDPAFRKSFAESYMAENDVEPRVTREERKTMQDVLELISNEDLDGAATLLERSRNEKASAVFDFTLANIRFQQERLDEAAAAYEVAVGKFPNFRRAWQNLGLIYARQSELAKALPALTRVVELGGGSGVTYGLIGYAYLSEGNDLSAESAYRMAVLLDPDTLEWKMGLAKSLFRQEEFARAASLCGGLIESDPDRAELWLLQANAYIGLNQPLKAAENFELVDRMGGSTFESLSTLGDIYINEQLFDDAVDTYTRALDRDPDASPARTIRAAKVLAARGATHETSRLLKHLERTLGDRLEDADKKDLLKLRARIAVAEGAGEEEPRVLEEIVALDPLDGEALILLGQYYGRTGDPDQAIMWYERAAGLDDYEADAKVRHAQLLVGLGRYDDAVPLLVRAQAVSPRDNVRDYLERVERAARGR